MKYKTKKAFTLIELLVVIAIIGLLASIVLVALNGARQKARDVKRQGDLRQFRTALEAYYGDNNGYPAGMGAGANVGIAFNLAFNGLSPGLTPTYLGTIPRDPNYPNLPNGYNDYQYVADCASPGPCANYGILVYYEGTGASCKYISAGGSTGWWGAGTPICSK
jgi:prepilin-type N-terminal cleavage/methylation domain-containing protein